MKEIQKLIKRERIRLGKYYGKSKSSLVLPYTVKLMEELGELCELVLASKKLQRNVKLKKLKKSNLQDEFADVFISVMILADTMGIDIEDAFNKKLKIVRNRHKK